jgi:2-C-methyl-D-erythritol 4-phosphate cytidylyltransferase
VKTPTIAVILAAGNGQRARFNMPKQLVDLAGKPLVWHSLKKFDDSPEIDVIILVSNSLCQERMWGLVREGGFSKIDGLSGVITGGETRCESTLSAIRYCDMEITGGREANFLIHDSARPLVTGEMIAGTVAALDKYDAVTTAVPVTDTIAVMGDDGLIDNVPSRGKMYAVQTPQGFRLSVLKKAYARAIKDPKFEATDDCGVVKKYLPKAKIGIVQGDKENIKLTYASDLAIIENILRSRGVA